MRKGKAMKRRNIIITVFLALVLGMTGVVNTVKAQTGIFIMEDEEYYNLRDGDPDWPDGFIIPDLPDHDDTHDWTPIGDGLWLLGCLGGAYLLGKRRRSKEELSD